MKISVVITNHNQAKLLERTILSAKNQTHSELEFVIVDNGSQDFSRQVIEFHQKGDERVKFIIRPVEGLIEDCIGEGLEKCTGDLVTILQCPDEFCHLEFLSMADMHFKKFPQVGIVYGFAQCFEPSGIYRGINGKYNGIDNEKSYLSGKDLVPSLVSAKDFQKSLLESKSYVPSNACVFKLKNKKGVPVVTGTYLDQNLHSLACKTGVVFLPYIFVKSYSEPKKMDSSLTNLIKEELKNEPPTVLQDLGK